MGAECFKCGRDVIDDCAFCDLREDFERQKELTIQWATEAERLRAHGMAMAEGILAVKMRGDRSSWDEVEIARANFLSLER